ncbi:hypothetical protein [Maridesulfovibrio ferrireducens]|uniref:hypothetical protein n=1 Tax=Maridesulfovibrio ferrireducens TaxID=246191 RepID=UPI001A1B5FC0|nr:hypothetical protein [Maridesulfovibrio ferrireducens]MBI9112222.1 hypothetical protein [Maridesulfovibrio ferrireducens]
MKTSTTHDEFKGFVLLYVVLLLLFALGVFFNNGIVTYPFMILEWCSFFYGVATFFQNKKPERPSDADSLVNKIDGICVITLIICSAWWTLLAFCGGWVSLKGSALYLARVDRLREGENV